MSWLKDNDGMLNINFYLLINVLMICWLFVVLLLFRLYYVYRDDIRCVVESF